MAVPKEFILLGLLGVALLFSIIGLAIPRWSATSRSGSEAHSGLWKTCAAYLSKSSCSSFADPSSRLIFIRAMEVLGMLLTLGALVCVFVRKFVLKDSLILHKAIGGLATTAGLMMLIGCITYAASSDVSASSLSAGFALCIVAGILAIVGGILQYVLKENQLD